MRGLHYMKVPIELVDLGFLSVDSSASGVTEIICSWD